MAIFKRKQEEEVKEQPVRNVIVAEGTSKNIKAIMSTIDDSINKKYPALAVQALFDADARETLRKYILKDHKLVLSEEDSYKVISELVGLGYFDELVKDESVTDIGWNGTALWVKTSDDKKRIEHPDLNEAYILKVVQRFANFIHQDFSEKNPILNAQLGNIRINAMHRVVSPVGTTMSMRHARNRLVLTPENWHNTANIRLYHLLDLMVKIGVNLVITGTVGTGKTELQKLLIGSTEPETKIVMVEDTLETHLKDIYPEKDILSWLIAPGYSATDFVKQALRNDPTYNVLSEARDQVIYEIHQSVLSGHKILLTGHAENARAFVPRMIGMTKQGYDVDADALRDEILRYYDIGIHLKRRTINGKTYRFIAEVVEYTKEGLVTLYERKLYYYPDAENEEDRIVIKENFGRLSDDWVERLQEHGYTTDWNDYPDIKQREPWL